MRRRKWKGSKAVLPLLLSALMVVEPLGTAATVYAEEITPPPIVEEAEQEENISVEENLPDDEEIKDENDNQEENDTEQDGSNQETEPGSENRTEEENENIETDDIDQKEEPSDESSDSENSETDETVLPEENNGSEDEPEEEAPGNESEEETVSGNDLEDESVSGNDLEEAEQGIDTEQEQFTDMPEKYQLTASQRMEKEVLAGEVGNINEEDEGVLYAKGQVMVAANSQDEAEMIAEAYNAEIIGFDNGLLLLKLQEGSTVASAVKAAASARNRLPAVWPNYYRYPHVEAVALEDNIDTIQIEETEYEIEADVATGHVEQVENLSLEAYEKAAASYNDPDLLSDSSQYQWQHVAVGSPYAWAEGYTGAGVKVAILDTGVMGTHSELTLAGEANATGSSVVTGSGAAADNGGHGTHVAGIIGAKANNAAGGAGIAPDATLYAVNVLNGGENAGSDWAITQGIEQAIKWDVDIINMSLGGPGYNDLSQKTVTKAYNQGIAIFVSAGNDGANCINYPAHYDNIICVAATDQDNSRADFSTYGSWVDLSAPGVAIWSTYNNGGYTIMDGTSMACPVAAGEAAVILSGDESLKAMGKNGDKVDALERKMKGNAIKVSGSGMGSGVTSLTKVFKLTTAAAKPQAPSIDIVPDDTAKAQEVTVTIAAQGGMTIYYTDNGKNPVYKNGVADANTKLYTKPFKIQNSAKGTVKAIAVNESGVASPVKAAKYTLMPYVKEIIIDGVEQVAAGKSIQLTAEVLPAYATNKKLDWKLYTKDGVEATAAKNNISISPSGKITAKSGAEVGATFTVRATAQDGSDQYGEYTITVIANTKVKSAKFTPKSITLYVPKDKDYDLASIFTAELSDGTASTVADFKWSSSNKSIATVNKNGVVQPRKAGKATITAMANDSSGKKATCTVVVKQLATKIHITGSSSVAAGKGVAYKATILPSDVSVKKVSWSVIDDATGKEPDVSSGVKINQNSGKLTTKSTSKGSYTVKASATDDSGEEATKKIVICDGAIKNITFSNASDKKVTIFRRKINDATKTSAEIQLQIEGTTAQADLDAYEVSSSNPGIATASSSRTGNVITLNINATGRSAGKTNIILAATDGSGKKVSCAVTVNNPVTKVNISSATKTMSARMSDDLFVDMLVVKGKSIQLKATLESEYGAISNKKVNWSINAPAASGITISKSGKVSAKGDADDTYIYRVTAEAADGSGAKATYNVAATDPATIVAVPALVPRPGYINALNPMPLDEDGNQQILQLPIVTDVSGGYVEAISSNPKALEVTVYYRDGYRLLMTAHDVTKDTMVKITVRVTDGSGKKATYPILITNQRL